MAKSEFKSYSFYAFLHSELVIGYVGRTKCGGLIINLHGSLNTYQALLYMNYQRTSYLPLKLIQSNFESKMKLNKLKNKIVFIPTLTVGDTTIFVLTMEAKEDE